MQLLVLPPEGRTVRFKVMDEFGNQFEVNNCSSCYHWVTAKPQGPAVFSADYKGCHVLEKAGRAHLSVFIEALLPDGRVDVAQNLTLVCPKPAHSWTTAHGPLVPSTSFSLSTPHTRELSPTTEPSVSPPTPASPALGSGPTHPTRAGAQGATEVAWGADKPEDIGTRPTPEQCRGDSGHIPCMARGSSKEACQQAGCCYDNTRDVPCYYGNTATVQCFRDGHFVLVVSRETALAHRVTLANVHLAYAPTRCAPTQDTGAFVVFRFPFTHCGTTIQAGAGGMAEVVGNQLIYENQLVSDVDVQVGPRGAITRDGSFRLQVRCIFNGSDFLPLQAAVFPPVSPASVAQPGPLRLELRIAKVGGRLAFSPPRCPFEGDSYRTRLVALDRAELPFPAHYQRFTVATFAFLDSGSSRALRGPVYFFCSASACSPSGLEPCSAPCGSRTARSAGNSDPRLPLGVALLLAAVALVLGIGVFVGLSRAQAPGLLGGSRG
ncbi:Zona pellucida sperm-binding protein 1 [Myotis brandtii]|uniref:Zona pellucida sperm-binding protein 1 n=1 Tax=Myotis brandtii TaxID=109478 RepID=S7PH62_MYOBR|nr:Zona pellucida sperm-binding protein 1 [Myotis brandtii]